jgi:polyhydroxyalkanoate synthase
MLRIMVEIAAKLRVGPKPLMAHIGLVGTALEGRADAPECMADMLRGIKRYQSIDYTPRPRPYQTVWRDGQTSLRLVSTNFEVSEEALAATQDVRDICVFVPSLINASDILNLSEERSLAGFFADNGFHSFYFDWGNLCEEPAEFSIAALIETRIAAALAWLRDAYPQARVHLFGYCMGGALALGLAHLDQLQKAPRKIASLTLLATPWDFHAGFKTLLNRVKFWSPAALNSVRHAGFLAADYLQSLFASIDPSLTQAKFSSFAKMQEESPEARVFVAVEDWLNNGCNLPKIIAEECIEGWFFENKVAAGKWVIGGAAVQPERLDIPVLVVASQSDRIVEYECALALYHALCARQNGGAAALLRPDCGHIGMIAGKRSVEKVWQPILAWMRGCF